MRLFFLLVGYGMRFRSGRQCGGPMESKVALCWTGKFSFGGHQSMFIVTAAGVIATDPISE